MRNKWYGNPNQQGNEVRLNISPEDGEAKFHQGITPANSAGHDFITRKDSVTLDDYEDNKGNESENSPKAKNKRNFSTLEESYCGQIHDEDVEGPAPKAMRLSSEDEKGGLQTLAAENECENLVSVENPEKGNRSRHRNS
ncbi:MAG: hypothetical protein HOL58_01155 [Francisellaceae bacterium]|nr:hypothetical protein [Francisellaceae bacterium]